MYKCLSCGLEVKTQFCTECLNNTEFESVSDLFELWWKHTPQDWCPTIKELARDAWNEGSKSQNQN